MSSGRFIQGRACSGAGTCKTRALLALRACTASARRNARVAQTARDQMQNHRSGLETISKLLDNLFWTDGKVHNTKPSTMPNLSMHTGCLTKCQRHLGRSWSGQIPQISVSLDAQEGGEVSLWKAQTCYCKFCRISILDRM